MHIFSCSANKSTSSWQLVCWLLVCVLSLRAFVPTGFMLGHGSSDHEGFGDLIVMCSGDSASAELMSLFDDEDFQGSTTQHIDPTMQLCAFSSTGLAESIASTIAHTVDVDNLKLSVIAYQSASFSPPSYLIQISRAPPSSLS